MEVHELERKSIQYRRTILSIIKRANGGHTGGSLSCVDILNVLYNHTLNVTPETFSSPDRDRYIQSKGHSVEALFTVLADRGYFPREELDTLGQYQSHFIGHPTRKVNGIEQNTGALGHGLPIAVGTALAGKKDQRAYKVFTLLGDGELTEGSNWEAMMAAAHYKLDNLVVIIDRNTLQITGRTEFVLALEPLEDKFRSFGFEIRSVPGNNIVELIKTFEQLPFEKNKPNLVIARTTKGKGVSFMEDVTSWHHHVPSDEEYKLAMEELQAAEDEWLKVYE
jgi:transketolase